MKKDEFDKNIINMNKNIIKSPEKKNQKQIQILIKK